MKIRRYDLAVVGELNPDLILKGDIVPEFGQVEKLIDKADLTIGSSSAIFACGAAKLGLTVAFIGKVGGDLFGEFMRQALSEYKIDTSGIVVDKELATGISIILARGTDRAILTYPGTIPLLSYAEINLDMIQQARHLHVGSYFIQDALRPDLPKLFDRAHTWGLTTSLDPNYDPRNQWNEGIERVLQTTDLFLPNAAECMKIAIENDLDQATNRLQAKIAYLGVKLGDDGALLFHKGKKYQMPSIPVEVVDTVGAGDSFDAGFVYGYLAGWEPEMILKLAVCCGSLSTRQAGGTAAQATLDEAMQCLRTLSGA